MPICTVIVAHQIGRRRCPGEGLGDLSRQPLGCRMPRHLEPQQLPPAVAQNQEREQALKGQRRDHAHVNGSDRLGVVSRNVFQDCEGGLRPRIMYLETVDWATSNPSISSSPWIRGAPQSGFSLLIRRMRSRSSTINLRPPCPISRFPAPKRFEARAMPSQDRLRLYDLRYVEQAGPEPHHPHQQRPVTTVQPQTRRRSPQSDIELMTEKQVLGFEPASRLEDVGDEHHEQLQDRQASNLMMQ